MNKNIKDKITLSFLAFSIFLLPTVINDYFIEKKTDVFFQRLDEDFDDCVANANENSRNIDWCKETRK